MTSAPAASRTGARTASLRFRRTLLSARWWHNWIGVFLGVVMTLWIASGLVMLSPASKAARGAPGTGRPIDWSSVAISPAQAAHAATGAGSARVRGLELKRLRDGMAYIVRLDPPGTVIVDATTGSTVMIGDSLAAAMAGEGLSLPRPTQVERLEQQTRGYRGPLPAWHVVFGDAAGTEAYVAIATGEVRRTERMDRLKATWGHSAHVFTPLDRGSDEPRTSRRALWTTSILTLVTIAAGYWLALPRTWRRRKQ